jgi:hypothetical protein
LKELDECFESLPAPQIQSVEVFVTPEMLPPEGED